MEDTKTNSSIEEIESLPNQATKELQGTFKLITHDQVVLIPTPSRDPRGKDIQYIRACFISVDELTFIQ